MAKQEITQRTTVQGINFIGNIYGSTGYVIHSRNLLRALQEEGIRVHLDSMRPNGWEAQTSDQELLALNTPRFDDGITIMIGTPEYWKAGMVEPCKEFWGFAVWEGTRVPLHWKTPLEEADRILVPSTHVRDAIMNTFPALTTPISIIPHGVDSTLFIPQPDTRPARRFVFVANKGWAKGNFDRGGVQFLLRAFCEEFKPNEAVELRLKINTAYCPPGWDLTTELNKLPLPPPSDRPQVRISTDSVPYDKLPSFYAGADCFVSPTMAEGFSIPCLESMSCGIPVITTGFGGQTDFITNEVGWLTPYALVEVIWDVDYEGVEWAQPDIMVLRKQLRYAFEHRSECVLKGENAREIAKTWSWTSSAKKIIELF